MTCSDVSLPWPVLDVRFELEERWSTFDRFDEDVEDDEDDSICCFCLLAVLLLSCINKASFRLNRSSSLKKLLLLLSLFWLYLSILFRYVTMAWLKSTKIE